MNRLVGHTALALALLGVPLIAAAGQDARASAPAPASSDPPVDPRDSGQTSAAKRSSPWLLVPVVSSNPKLGTAFGALGAYLHVFDSGSRVSLFGVTYQYTSTHSTVAAAFARTSFGADHHRIVAISALGNRSRPTTI